MKCNIQQTRRDLHRWQITINWNAEKVSIRSYSHPVSPGLIDKKQVKYKLSPWFASLWDQMLNWGSFGEEHKLFKWPSWVLRVRGWQGMWNGRFLALISSLSPWNLFSTDLNKLNELCLIMVCRRLIFTSSLA